MSGLSASRQGSQSRLATASLSAVAGYGLGHVGDGSLFSGSSTALGRYCKGTSGTNYFQITTDAGGSVAATHGYVADTPIRFGALGTSSGLNLGQTYYVKQSINSTTFTISETLGGSEFVVSSSFTATQILSQAEMCRKLVFIEQPCSGLQIVFANFLTYAGDPTDAAPTNSITVKAAVETSNTASPVTTPAYTASNQRDLVIAPGKTGRLFCPITISARDCTFSTSGNTVNLNNHGMAAGYQVIFNNVTGASGIASDTRYFVSGTVTTNSFQISATSGGTALTISSDGTGQIQSSYVHIRYRLSVGLTEYWDKYQAVSSSGGASIIGVNNDGERSTEGGPNLTDRTDSTGTSGWNNDGSNTSGRMYAPLAVIASTATQSPRKRSVLVLGDSIAAPKDSWVAQGLRRCGIPYYNLARPGEASFQFLPSGSGNGPYAQAQYRREMIAMIRSYTDVIIQYGRNSTNYSASEIQDQIEQIVAWVKTQKSSARISLCTVTPKSESTDSWITVNNQTSSWSNMPPKSCTFTSSTNRVTITGHGLDIGTDENLPIRFSASTASNVNINTDYFIKTIVDANNVTISSVRGGSTLSLGSNGSGTVVSNIQVHNAWIRSAPTLADNIIDPAALCEDGGSGSPTGRWVAPGGTAETNDGTHPSNAGKLLVSSAITPDMFPNL